MPPETAGPVRLTFPACGEGGACILADGVRVGHVHRGSNGRWAAVLWNQAGSRDGGFADAPVVRPRLRDMRAYLRGRVEQRGPWWVGDHPDGRES